MWGKRDRTIKDELIIYFSGKLCFGLDQVKKYKKNNQFKLGPLVSLPKNLNLISLG